MRDYMTPDYGNWVPKKLLVLFYLMTLVSAVLLGLTVFYAWPMSFIMILAVVLCVSLFFSCYMTALIPIPKWMQVPGMLTGVGIIYGKK